MRRVLVIDDEPAVSDVVAYSLTRAGFEVRVETSLASGREALRENWPDLLVLDLGLPDGDGLDLCRELRGSSGLPIVMLTCRQDEVDRVLGLESGADDYLVKPFSPRELTARIRSVLRRSSPPHEGRSAIVHGQVRLEPDARCAMLRDKEVRLSRTEFDLLLVLLGTPQKVYSRDELIERVYRGDVRVSHRTVDSHVKGIRHAFRREDAGCDPVETVYAVGYRAMRLPK